MTLAAQGKHAEAVAALERAVPCYESSLLAGASGLNRAELGTFNPRLLLAVSRQARAPAGAWHLVELARGLLDQQAGRSDTTATPEERIEQVKLRERLAELQPQILFLATKAKRTDGETVTLELLLGERRAAETRLAVLAVAVSPREVVAPTAIQATIPANAALVFRVDASDKTGAVQEGLVKPMGKAAVLDGAKRWLRDLSGEEALVLTAELTKGVARGTRAKDEVLKLAVPSAGPKAPPAKDRKPFAHPTYGAAFVLIGDPN